MNNANSHIFRIIGLLILLGSVDGAAVAQPEIPSAPADNWQGTNFNTARSASVSAVRPFDASIHEKMTPSGAVCSERLNAAIYRQDIWHALESYAHYDNCAFDDTHGYVRSLIASAGEYFDQVPDDWKDEGLVPEAALDGMLRLGQALHAVQDFYAHTNYVELVQTISPVPAREQDIPVVVVWNREGQGQIRSLLLRGLISGRVWWTFPHQCADGVATHAELAKDSAMTPSGAKLSIWKRAVGNKRQTNYNIAYNLAHRATREFLQWSGEQWPVIEKHCGKTLKYIVIEDRRKADLPEREQ